MLGRAELVSKGHESLRVVLESVDPLGPDPLYLRDWSLPARA